MKKNNSKEDLQSFLTFDSHPKLIAYLFTFFWAFFVMALLGQLIKCIGSYLLIFLFSFTLYVLPSWLGLFYSKKKGHYILSILILGFFWMLGFVAYEGMNCRG